MESCDPPPTLNNIRFQLIANPSIHHLKQAHSQLLPQNNSYSEKREHSKESSTASYSFVSTSSTNTLQRVILLEDTDTMNKYKKYSLSPALSSKKTKNNRLIFQIRIEFIKRNKYKIAYPKARTNSLSTSAALPKAGSVTPSDAYSVVSVDSLPSTSNMQKKRKLEQNSKGKTRKKYKFCIAYFCTFASTAKSQHKKAKAQSIERGG